jgi:pimeloyl-ACP methyl ester carboxylesterase
VSEPAHVPARAAPGRLEAALSILNAVVGDHLRRRSNALEIPFGLRRAGEPLPCERAALARAQPEATGRLCVLVHGLAVNEGVWSFPGDPLASYGSLLRRDLGYTPYEVRYNTGLHISDNGRELARLLDALVRSHPVEVRELVLVGHSMGGLVVRSACELARASGQPWLALVTHAFYLGSPHLGAPLEKVGNVVSWMLQSIGLSHTSLVADVLDIRSAGIKDLRFANLVAADWEGRDPDALLQRGCAAVPLAPGVAHHFGVGGLGADERHVATRLFGDAMVRVSSAAACRPGPGGAEPRQDVRFFPRVGHHALAHHPDVYAWLRACCAGEQLPEAS